MIGMNNYFYTFKGGNLYRHNVNEERNTFYGEFQPSEMQSVFNTSPLENKIFKTINIEGDDAWAATLQTDLEDSGFIEYDWFEKKEQAWFGFVRNLGLGSNPSAAPNYSLRSLNGIGDSSTVSIVGTVSTVIFSLSVAIGNIISIGDYFYFLSATNAPIYAGNVTDINIDLRRGINNVVIDTSPAGTTAIPEHVEFANYKSRVELDGGVVENDTCAIDFLKSIGVSGVSTFLYIKNSVAESHGVLGHYAVFSLTSEKTTKVELFALESEVMKSYP
jgi:hypothetical protein